ncbi:MAG: MBL fold metallo-hydrolase [Flavobacteriales bacterium]|jgi:glyoxylase-like metal-dependent hydrolase (beta-lactamase superfamily II)|nr:MBL fold metallo-hydrolase [Flavobacteriales bacterium]
MLHILRHTFNPFQENTYVVHDGGEAILIDPGCWNTDEETTLARSLDDAGLTPVKLVLTHAHIDHVLGNAAMHQRYGLRPWMHRNDLPLLEAAPRQGHVYGIPCEPSPGPEGFLDEGDTVELSGGRMEVLFVPGHAPGHIVLHCREQGFVIGGDVLFRESIGRTDLPGGDTATLLHHIREKLFTLPDDTVVYPGHGPETTIGHEKRVNPFLRG